MFSTLKVLKNQNFEASKTTRLKLNSKNLKAQTLVSELIEGLKLEPRFITWAFSKP
jgi:hypothetical protein